MRLQHRVALRSAVVFELAALLVVCHAARAAETGDQAPYLGAHTPEAVLAHFKAQKHPYLFVTKTNRDEIRARIASEDPVYKEAWDSIRKAVVGYHMPGVAFRLAVVGATDKACQATVESLRTWRPPWKDGQKWWANYQTAANVIGRLQAFDAVRGLGLMGDEDEKAFADKLVDLIETKGLRVQVKDAAWTGNINESIAVMQCLAAIVLPRHPKALAWYRDGSRHLQMAYDQKLNGANLACQAEGQTYQVGFSYQVLANLAVPLEEHGFAIVRRDDNFLEECFEWTVWSLRPNGTYPTTEDAWMRSTLTGIWPARYARPEVARALRWQFARHWASPKKKVLDRNMSAVTALLAWDPNDVPARPAGRRTRFSELASTAVFATDWTPESSWLYFLGDRTPWRFEYYGAKNCANNKPHAHGDQTSFTLHAMGKYLATETARFSGSKAENHNLLLVDGNPDAPSAFQPAQFTELSRHFDLAELAGATMKCAYAGVVNQRSVLCVRPTAKGKEREYFVVFDNVAAEGEHSYEWRLHNREKGAKIEPAGKDTARVVVDDVTLDVRFVSPALEAVAVQNAKLPSFSEVFLGAKAKATGNVRWITVLAPRKSSDPPLAVTPLKAGGATVATGASRDAIVVGRTGAETAEGKVSVDAGVAFVRQAGKAVKSLCLRDGSVVRVGQTAVFQSSEAVEVAAAVFDGDKVRATIVLARKATVKFQAAPGGPSASMELEAGRHEDLSFQLQTAAGEGRRR